MKTRTILALLTCAAMTAALTACGDTDDGGKLEKKSFKITERESDDFGFSDNKPTTKLGDQGPEKLSAGDQLSFRSDLIRGGKDVGALFAQCTVITGNSFNDAGGDCAGVYELPEGSLSAHLGGERLFGSKTSTGTITGGTGDYVGASGTFSSPNSEGEGDTVSTITIYVPKD